MKNIKITEDNVETYRKFVRVKKNFIIYDNAKLVIKIAGVVILYLLITFGLGVGIAALLSLFENYSFILQFIGLELIIINGVVGPDIIKKIVEKIAVQEFKKNHPDFDTNIDVNELEKELEKYDILSSIPKDIDKKQEEVISRYDEFKQVNNEERIEYLKNELKILEQVEQKNIYGIDENDIEENYQKKIGSIN